MAIEAIASHRLRASLQRGIGPRLRTRIREVACGDPFRVDPCLTCRFGHARLLRKLFEVEGECFRQLRPCLVELMECRHLLEARRRPQRWRESAVDRLCRLLGDHEHYTSLIARGALCCCGSPHTRRRALYLSNVGHCAVLTTEKRPTFVDFLSKLCGFTSLVWCGLNVVVEASTSQW